MSLRHAILGVLSAKPMTGYDLLEVFDRSSGYVWPAGQPQIYPELKKMARDGLLSSKLLHTGRRAKRVYAVNAKGHRELQRWVGDDPEYGPERDRDSVRLRAMYLDVTDTKRARKYFEGYQSYYQGRIAQWRQRLENVLNGESPLIKARLASRNSDEHDAIIAYKRFALEGQIARGELEIEWARQGLQLVQRLEAARLHGARSVSA
jgi:PadR family transcriptional regulator, regulatory protein AphA